MKDGLLISAGNTFTFLATEPTGAEVLNVPN